MWKFHTASTNEMNSADQIAMLYHIDTTFERFLFCLWISEIPLSLWFFLQMKILMYTNGTTTTNRPALNQFIKRTQ